MKIIKEEYSLGTQSVHLSKIIEGDKGLKIKVDIKSDSYDFQSYARISVFNSTEVKWHILDNIAFSNMKTPPKLYYQVKQENPNILAKHFFADTQILISHAEAILGDNFSPSHIVTKSLAKKLK